MCGILQRLPAEVFFVSLTEKKTITEVGDIFQLRITGSNLREDDRVLLFDETYGCGKSS